MPEANTRKQIKVVGANPAGGGVLTYILNLQASDLEFEVYGYKEYFRFLRDLKRSDTIFFNVVKPSLPYFLISLLATGLKLRRVYCGHGLNYKYYDGLKRFLVKQAERLISSLSDTVIVLNERDLESFAEWNPNSILIPTCLKPMTSNIADRDRITRAGRGINWLAVGSVENRKDPKYFVRIGRELLKHFPDDRFTWIGQGPLFKELIDEVRLESRISFLGRLSNLEVRKLMFDADIFICTSTYEVLPISILEAVEGGSILAIRDYYYSGDVCNRFTSSVLFHSIEDLFTFRKDADKLARLENNARELTLGLREEFDKYIAQMKEVLC